MSLRFRTGAWRMGAWLLAACLAVPPAVAQHPNHAQGFRPEHVFDLGAVEHVNLFNGNLTLTIPLGPSYPVGPELSYQLLLTWTGNVWEWEERCPDYPDRTTCYLETVPRMRSNAGLGWEVSLGRILTPDDVTNTSETPSYESPDQAVHALHPNFLHPGGQQYAADVFFTQDGTYLRYQEPELEMPDGTVRSFDGQGRLTTIEDPFGNSVDITYPDSTTYAGIDDWRITDSHGRVHRVLFEPSVHYPRRVAAVELEAFGGETASYDLSYASPFLPPACNDPGGSGVPAKGGNVHLPLLTEVKLPGDPGERPSYSMPAATHYHDTDGTCAERALNGHLERLDLPTGGAFEWDWDWWGFPNASKQLAPLEGGYPNPPFTRSVGLMQRRHVEASGDELGRWVYDHGLTSIDNRALESFTEVTDPGGDTTVHYFSVYADDHDSATPEPSGWHEAEYGLPFTRRVGDGTGAGRFLSRRVYDGSATAGTLLRSIYVRYERSGGTKANPRVASRRTVFEDDPVGEGHRFAQTDSSDFDGLGHYRQAVTSGNFPGSNARTTFTAYNPGSSVTSTPLESEPWILDTFTERRVTEAGRTFVRQFCFDGATGFLERTRTLANTTLNDPTPAGRDVVVERLQSTAGGSQSDGFVRRERFYGGDPGVGVGTGDLCTTGVGTLAYQQNHSYQSGVLATSTWQGTSFFTVDRTIDADTGLVAASRDTAGYQTAFEYDELGRLTRETPEDGAVTLYDYTEASGDDPPKVTIETKETPSSQITLTEREILFDGFGRTETERRRMPNGTWAERTTLRDALDRVTQRTEWHAESDSDPGATVYGGYDPLGRPGTITLPDGHVITLGYAGESARTVKVDVGTTIFAGGSIGTGVGNTSEIYDRFGRLTDVREPGDPGDRTRTVYDYDARDRLVRVRMNMNRTPVQTRTFTYDGRGFLLSETHPELDPLPGETTKTIDYQQHDARGNPGRMLRGAWDLRYGYDDAGRLTSVTEAGTGRLWKEWDYASDNLEAGPRGKGKLASMKRHNWVVPPGGSSEGDFQVTEEYTYGGVGGRMSRVETRTNVGTPGEDQHLFVYGLTYDALGRVTRRDYPDCDFDRCTTIDPDARDRTVTQGFTRGLLSSIDGFAPSIRYHANGTVRKVRHANGVDWIQRADPDAMQRPSRIYTSGASDELDTGLYGFDGAGNVTRTGADRFVYDRHSRITEARLGAYPESCEEDLTLSFRTESSPVTHKACGRIDAGPDYTVASEVTLRAEEDVALHDGFSVAADGSLTVEAGQPVNDAPPGPVTRTQSYAYDRFGNRTETITDGTTRTTTVDATTNRLGSTLFSYDASGNVTGQPVGGTSWVYDHDPFDMLREARPVGGNGYTFLYGPGDERFWVIDWTDADDPADPGTGWVETYTLRDLDGSPLRQYRLTNGNVEGTWSLFRDYVWRDGTLLAAIRHAGSNFFAEATYFLHPDHLGTPRLITREDGDTATQAVYFPYGEQATAADGLEPLQFTGHERDDLDEGGTIGDLDYMHSRYYSPHLGRFLSVDSQTRRQALNVPQFYNRYSYVRGNPLKYVDPDGRCAVPAGLQEGQVGICIEAFIASNRVGGSPLGFFGFGDNRTFTPNDPDATFRISYRSIIDPQSGEVVKERTRAGVSEVGLTRGTAIGLRGTADAVGASASTENGTRFSIFLSGKNGFAAVNNLGSIGAFADFTVDRSGTVTPNDTSASKGYPSIEGFAYRIVQGELVIQVIYNFEEEDPSELNGPVDDPLKE